MLQWGLRAAMLRLPFLPTRAGLATDVARLSPQLETVRSPYADGEVLLAMPALQLDAALVHVDHADERGNAQILGPDPYFDDLFCGAAKRRFVSLRAHRRDRGAHRAAAASIRCISIAAWSTASSRRRSARIPPRARPRTASISSTSRRYAARDHARSVGGLPPPASSTSDQATLHRRRRRRGARRRDPADDLLMTMATARLHARRALHHRRRRGVAWRGRGPGVGPRPGAAPRGKPRPPHLQPRPPA